MAAVTWTRSTRESWRPWPSIGCENPTPLDRPQVYVGQQATLLVQVYAQQPIDARGLEMPKLPKFWVEQLELIFIQL